MNTVLVAGVIAPHGNRSIYRTWYQTYFWVLPYHLAAASVAWLIVVLSRQNSWHAALVLFPLVYFVYRSYKMYLDRLERDKVHVEEIAGLHLRTIEALALAIEAKDHTTHDHLQRVRVYATEIGKELGLGQNELDALQAAALLHDIGKLAVPGAHHFEARPLTPEEFEKMKIHPLVGGGDSGRGQVPLSGGSDRAGASRKVGWLGLSVWTFQRRDSDRREHSVGGRLPRCAGVGSAVPPGSAAGSGDGNRNGRIGQELRSAGSRYPVAPLCRNWSGSPSARASTRKRSSCRWT